MQLVIPRVGTRVARLTVVRNCGDKQNSCIQCVVKGISIVSYYQKPINNIYPVAHSVSSFVGKFWLMTAKLRVSKEASLCLMLEITQSLTLTLTYKTVMCFAGKVSQKSVKSILSICRFSTLGIFLVNNFCLTRETHFIVQKFRNECYLIDSILFWLKQRVR